jgi:hypothetical protein
MMRGLSGDVARKYSSAATARTARGMPHADPAVDLEVEQALRFVDGFAALLASPTGFHLLIID